MVESSDEHPTMNTRPCTILLPLLMLAPALPAQDEGFPAPAPELAKLKDFAGHWQGTGTATMGPGAPPTKWTSHTTYRWVMGDHWLLEDTWIEFEGLPTPMAFRGYLGWDRENQRHVSLMVTNTGEAGLHQMDFLPDGTVLQMMRMVRDGVPMVERSRSTFDGKTVKFAIDMLLPEGPSTEMVSGTMHRVDKPHPHAVEATAAMAPPAAAMQKLMTMAGTYTMTGQVTMAPGVPPLKIQGTDVVTPIYGGTILMAHTTGRAEGSPAAYESAGFHAWDAAANRYRVLFVDNMGSVGTMESWFGADDKSLLSVAATTQGGQPVAMRYVTELDDAGRIARGFGHALMGSAAPYESFRGEYKFQSK